MNHLQFIIDTIAKYPDSRVMFDDGIQIKTSPHIYLFTVYGLWSGPDGVYLLDGGGDWHGPLREDQTNAGLMIASIYQRLKAMQVRPSVVIARYDNEVNATIVE
jgi:hypothetical protein